jgi:ubiquinone biosynthesis protein Coq4
MPTEEAAIQWVEWSALGTELLAVALLVATILVSTSVYALALAVQYRDRVGTKHPAGSELRQ